MSTTVYAVVNEGGDLPVETTFFGVFSTLEKAQELCQKINSDPKTWEICDDDRAVIFSCQIDQVMIDPVIDAEP